MKLLRLAVAVSAVGLTACESKPAPLAPAAPPPPIAIPELPALTEQSASNFAQIALKCVQKEYPNSPGFILNAPQDVQAPGRVHPAFYGCYDWHSSVHGHWMLARLLRLFPNLPEKDRIVRALNANLTLQNIKTEAAYFTRPGTQAFERMYGWAWTLKLAEELRRSSSAAARQWLENLKPLSDTLAKRYLDFLPKQFMKVSTGSPRSPSTC